MQVKINHEELGATVGDMPYQRVLILGEMIHQEMLPAIQKTKGRAGICWPGPSRCWQLQKNTFETFSVRLHLKLMTAYRTGPGNGVIGNGSGNDSGVKIDKMGIFCRVPPIH